MAGPSLANGTAHLRSRTLPSGSTTPFELLADDDSSEPEHESEHGPERDTDSESDSDEAHPWPHPQNDFAPPYYGRPPTPLPPSPSITSLLRPSRPTTPDASDDELEPVPRAAAPRVPTYEYYGFVLYLFSSGSFLVYLLWAFLPAPFIHALGITYYPDRWWALAVPAFLVVALVYIYVALAAYNVEILTLPMSVVETLVDEAAQVALVDAAGRLKDGSRMTPAKPRVMRGEGDLAAIWSEGTDAVMDIPLGAVCEVLYGRGAVDLEWEEEEEE
ncbi:hypothetical protein TD95_000298 [Thielaviopsis punctulata]|uniref:PIG-P domain-containing protein n=1 Tax=Thielaviopsis punctulata TaxID=72032 RepID=A0A0F4ZF70_9PEZI|nr:hypothetical protein TD95_000298 [Thielaviopsis punctulata]